MYSDGLGTGFVNARITAIMTMEVTNAETVTRPVKEARPWELKMLDFAALALPDFEGRPEHKTGTAPRGAINCLESPLLLLPGAELRHYSESTRIWALVVRPAA
ncbi:hypothetical protein NDU88_003887 [Pleurodeles waltl]|uniref:Uncharacterized protein n=1 Tax=Pleurodeles waltl TaxID=8319 RepID=A0AAV7MRW2_PLEWA|nr:hypothetical protein NDU88_003887 [Pleurodeles waltl]